MQNRVQTSLLYSLRNQRGLTQIQLAKLSGVSAHTIWSAEKGRRIRQSNRRKILRGLRLPFTKEQSIAIFGKMDLSHKEKPCNSTP